MANILSYIAEAIPVLRGILTVIVILGIGFALYLLWEVIIKLPGRFSRKNDKGGK